MSPSRRWYYQHLERERAKHREYQKGYMEKYRAKYRKSSTDYYRAYKEARKNMPKPDVHLQPGIPKQLDHDGVMLLIAAIIDQCRLDIKRWEKHIAKGEAKTSYKDVSYQNYKSAKEYLERVIPALQEVHMDIF